MPLLETPLPVFRFQVDFQTDSVDLSVSQTPVSLCQGSFSDCTGLEATMEPKVFKEGGLNYGSHQRAGQVSFSTVVLKRGYSSSSDLWTWFQSVASGGYAQRLTVIITVFELDGTSSLAWMLARALPVKFKAADLSAKSGDFGIEELHLVHEGLSLMAPTVDSLASS
jgi:phage tail-like protein